MGFYFVTTGWIFEIGLCVNSIKKSIKVSCVEKKDGGKVFFSDFLGTYTRYEVIFFLNGVSCCIYQDK